MARNIMRLAPNNNHIVNLLSYADWRSRVERRLEQRTGIRMLSNELPDAYWLGLYRLGDSYQDAADTFLEERR